MTSPETPYTPNITANPTIHKPAPQVNGVNRLTPQQVGAVGTVMVDLILAAIARAIGGISFDFSVLGQNFHFAPFNWLNGWAAELERQAQQAYKNAFIVVDVKNNRPVGTTTTAPAIDIYNAQAAILTQANNGATGAVLNGANIQQTWNSIVAGTYGGTGATGATGSTGATAGDVQAAVQYVSGTAAVATGNIQSTWNSMFYASGGTGAGDRSLSAAQTQLSTVTTTATSAALQASLAGNTATNALTTAQGATAAAATAQGTASSALAGNTATNVAIATGWSGNTGSTGSTADVQSTMEQIKTQFAAGYTIEVLTTSGTWPSASSPALNVPKSRLADFWVVCISGGNGGYAGGYKTYPNTATYGPGGDGAMFVSRQINVADLPSTALGSISYTIGLGNTGATGMTSGTASNAPVSVTLKNSTFGSLATSALNNGTGVGGAISTLFGYYDANSSAGAAGGAGSTDNASASSGSPSAAAIGGTGGAGGSTGNTGNAGGTGGSVDLSTIRCAGGGGGGGVGKNSAGAAVYVTGGRGGNGGFPGGGGGGGGGVTVTSSTGGISGTGGNGANGAIVLIYRIVNTS